MVQTVAVLVEERYRDQKQPAGLVAALRAAGAHVDLIGDSALRDWSPEGADIVVARGRSERLLDAIRTVHATGIPVLDAADAIAAVRDKAVMSQWLMSSGLPVPRTWVGNAARLARNLDGCGLRLIAKPVLGDNARGIRIVDDSSGLADLDGDFVVQEFLPGDGVDLKLYVIGEQVWATRKPSPVTVCTSRRLGAVRVTALHREVAMTCGRQVGLSMFGVDCLESGDGLVVIEVNDFPNYTSVPDAGTLLARHVLTQAA